MEHLLVGDFPSGHAGNCGEPVDRFYHLSLDEFIIAFFLAGTEPTLPVYIWGQLRFPQKLPSLMALGTLLLVLSISLLVLADYFRRRGLKKTGIENSGGFL